MPPRTGTTFALVVAFALLPALLPSKARADLDVGAFFDFEDGTVQGWSSPAMNTTNVASGGPLGVDDAYLEIAPGSGGHIAALNTDLGGVIDPAVTDIELDMRRPEGQGDLAVRLVLFGPSTSDRWTSTVAQTVPGDGVWRHYDYSILEEDLTQVQDLGGTYPDLQAGLVQVMFRHQSGSPSAFGTPNAGGVLDVDEILVAPEPALPLSFAAALGTVAAVRHRVRPRRR